MTRAQTVPLKALAALTLLFLGGCATTDDAGALVAYDRAARLGLVESRYQRSPVLRFQDAPLRLR